MTAPTPDQLRRRITALASYAIMDTPPERQFDDLARVASVLCQTPIALISLLDDSRQWFKARIGLEATETPIEDAFCAYAIEGTEVMVVPDAEKDPRFSTNPLVLGGPRIRFYAGAPLITSEGVALGALCAIDRRPRELALELRDGLGALARQAVNLLQLRRSARLLHDALIECEEARGEAQKLRLLLPICSICRKVRTDPEYWQSIEEYLRSAEGIAHSHGICPECEARTLGDLGR